MTAQESGQLLLLVEIPEDVAGNEDLVEPATTLAADLFTRAPAESATSVDDYLGALASAGPPAQLRLLLGGETMEVYGGRDEATILVASAYGANGRRGVEDVKAAIAAGDVPANPFAPTASVPNAETAKQRAAEYLELISAGETDLAVAIVEDLTQVEDAAVAILLDALKGAAPQLAQDAEDLMVFGKQGEPAFRRGDDGKIVPRAQEIVTACQELVELNQKIVVLGGIFLVAGGETLPTKFPKAITDPIKEMVERFAKRSTPTPFGAGALAAALSKVVGAIQAAESAVDGLKQVLLGLIHAHALMLARARKTFAPFDLVYDRMTSLTAPKIDETSMAAAVAAALVAADDGQRALIQAVGQGGMSLVRGKLNVPDVGPAAVMRFSTKEVPFVQATDYLTSVTPERALANGIELATLDHRLTVWGLPELIHDALATLPEPAVAEAAWREVQLIQISRVKVELLVALAQLGTNIALTWFSAGLSEVIQIAQAGLSAWHDYGKYQNDRDLMAVSRYFRQGLVDVEPSVLPLVADALSVGSSVAGLRSLAGLARLFDGASLGIAAFDLIPFLQGALSDAANASDE